MSRCTRKTRRHAARTLDGRGLPTIVGLLCLPGDDAVADVDLPGARPDAVDAVGRAHDLVMAPAIAVEDVTRPAALQKGSAPVRRFLQRVKNPSGASEARPSTPGASASTIRERVKGNRNDRNTRRRSLDFVTCEGRRMTMDDPDGASSDPAAGGMLIPPDRLLARPLAAQ